MIKTIKKVLSDYSDIDIRTITNDMSIKDDLYLDESDVEDVLAELQDHLGFDLDVNCDEIVYVSDLIAIVKAAI